MLAELKRKAADISRRGMLFWRLQPEWRKLVLVACSCVAAALLLLGAWFITDTATIVIVGDSHAIGISVSIVRLGSDKRIDFEMSDSAPVSIRLYAWRRYTLSVSKDYGNGHVFSDAPRELDLHRSQRYVYTVRPPSGVATLYLRNLSDGQAMFWVDGHLVGTAAPNTQYTVQLVIWKEHSISSVDMYGAQSYPTPIAQVWPNAGDIDQYLACGETGAPGSNCGLFSVYTSHPSQY